MMSGARRQGTLLLLIALAGGIGVGVGEWRRRHPELVERLERFDHVDPGPVVAAPFRWQTDGRGQAARVNRPSGHDRLEREERIDVPAPVDLNRASAEALAELPGVSPGLAQAIVATREARGPFASVDDLRWIRGIGPARLERLRPFLTVSP